MVWFEDERGYEKLALAILETVGNLRLVGDTGTGKTTFVYYLCEKYGWHLYETVLSSDSSRWELVATDTIVNGTTVPRKGIIVKWLEDTSPTKKVLYLNGCNYLPSHILSIIESLADFRGVIYVAELEQKLVRTKDHYIIIDQNPHEKRGYAGTFQSNIAQIRRFESIRFDYLSKVAEIKLLQRICPNLPYATCAKLANIAEKSRTLFRQGELSMPITTGNLINYAKMLEAGKINESDLLYIIASSLPEEEEDKVKMLFGLAT